MLITGVYDLLNIIAKELRKNISSNSSLIRVRIPVVVMIGVVHDVSYKAVCYTCAFFIVPED